MFGRKFTLLLGLITLFGAAGMACQTGAAGGAYGSGPKVMNKLFLEPQMSWPVQWDKVQGKPGYFWVCGQNSGFVSVWDDTTFEKVAHIDFWGYEKEQMQKEGKTIDEKTEDWIQKNIRPHHGWVAPDAKYFYVSNNSKKSDRFWVVDAKTFKIVKHFNTGGMGPLHGAFSPTEDLAIWGNVQDKKKGVITFIDTKKHEVIGVVKTTGVQTRDINFTHDGKTVFVGNQGWNKDKGIKGSIDVFDVKSRKMIKSITGAQGLKGMSMSKDGKTIVAAGRRVGKVYIIDVEKQAIRAIVDTGGNPSNISFHPTEPKFYVGLYKDKKTGIGNEYVVIDLATGSIITRIKGGNQANALYFPPGNPNVGFGANEKDTFISVIDTKNDKLIGEIETPLGSHNIRFRPDGKIGFATCKRSNEAVFFDVDKMEVLTVVEVGFGNNGVRWVPKVQ
jgi:DNA-binding beta-propeller fold protein YncE